MLNKKELAMSTIRVINGNYRGTPVIDTVFELVSGFQTGARGGYVTVKNNGIFPRCPETIRVRVEDISDIEYTTGESVKNNTVKFEKPVAAVETDEQAMDRIRERFEILTEMTKACVSGDIRAMIRALLVWARATVLSKKLTRPLCSTKWLANDCELKLSKAVPLLLACIRLCTNTVIPTVWLCLTTATASCWMTWH
jgi:hypothetical protein